MCSSLVIWIQSVHFVKKRNKKAVGSHVPRALSVWGKSQCQYVSDGFFWGVFFVVRHWRWLWFMKRLGDFTTLLLLVRSTSFTAISLKEEIQIFPVSRKLHHPFILSDRLPQNHEKEMLSIKNIWGEKMENWHYCSLCPKLFLFEQNV